MVKALGEFYECYKHDSVLEGRRAGVHVGAREEVSQDRVGAGPWPGFLPDSTVRGRGAGPAAAPTPVGRLGVVRTLISPKDSVRKVILFFFSFIRSHASRTHQMPSKQTRDGPVHREPLSGRHVPRGAAGPSGYRHGANGLAGVGSGSTPCYGLRADMP